MKKALLFFTVLILTVSCQFIMDPLRIPLDGTSWSYATDDQMARVYFADDSHVSVLQLDYETGYVQSLNGKYYCDGHAVKCNGNNWPNEIKFVRTFSHLKNNSTNKNLTDLYPKSYDSIEGSIWAVLEGDNFHMVYFNGANTCVEGSFKNVSHEEGVPYGWTWNKQDYTHTGSRVEAGPFKATLYDSFMAVDTLGVMIASPAVKQEGSSALVGTVWKYETSGYPGVFIFTSASEYTRLLVGNSIIHQVNTGTYQLQGTSLTIQLEDKEETCQLEGGRFTLFERTYAMVTIP